MLAMNTEIHNGDAGNLLWQDGQPVSARFGDVYFSKLSGIDETRFVFLQHNHLPERWPDLQTSQFIIAETGFGTGLNFLCAWQLWRQIAPAHARLHFVSTEQYPLNPADMAQALALWPQLAEFSSLFLPQYRLLAPGWRRMQFDQGRVTLTLLLGDARQTLPQLSARVDAWFLDGFAPARNPEMWQPEVFREIARLSHPGTTFATFTSAGQVRRGLAEHGFVVEKVSGFGSKREMLRGVLPGSVPEQPATERQAIVIGGGIAGTATAHSLARRGYRVILIERHATLAGEASGNPQGVLYPRLSGHDIPLSRVALLGFLFTRGLLETLLDKGQDWDDCGLLQLAFDAREAKRCNEVIARNLPSDIVHAVSAEQASALAGVNIRHSALFFPAAGWVHPPALCRALADHPNITTLHSQEALSLEKTSTGWQVSGAHGEIAAAPVVVLANANNCRRFAQTTHLPLEPVRGQITLLPASPASQVLQTVICTEGYVSPARNGLHCMGATFSPEETSLEIREADHAHNLATLKQLSPALHHALNADRADTSQLQGRAALRCTTPDYLPMAGQMLDASLVEERFEIGSRLGAEHLPWLDGLYVNAGHGSKGLLTAPLGAEIIAALLEHEPLPVDAALLKSLNPNRFLLRQRGLKRLIG